MKECGYDVLVLCFDVASLIVDELTCPFRVVGCVSYSDRLAEKGRGIGVDNYCAPNVVVMDCPTYLQWVEIVIGRIVEFIAQCVRCICGSTYSSSYERSNDGLDVLVRSDLAVEVDHGNSSIAQVVLDAKQCSPVY